MSLHSTVMWSLEILGKIMPRLPSVGRTLASGVLVGVAVLVAVLVAVGVEVAVAVFVGVGVAVAVGVGVSLGVAVLVGVGVSVDSASWSCCPCCAESAFAGVCTVTVK